MKKMNCQIIVLTVAFLASMRIEIMASTTTKVDTAATFPMLVTVDGHLVRLMNNCTVGDASSCRPGYCCTKQLLNYPADYSGTRPQYQIECKPLRGTGEFCYFNTPENFCPCITHCHTNGFYGSCV
ncbi:uncharacterized protein LOC128242239 [Mya arenaria]|uniref:uncharacterized protein LOC128242239 n=1 Tax=Mya arenaria TaxID=6604 RepID=UPI0022E4D99B|nr:uncharacterized protein LOC128242239 [Mya arenaria]